MSVLDLKVGDYVRHLKRGSVYQIIGLAMWSRHLKDGDQAKMFFTNGALNLIVDKDFNPISANMIITLSFQRSIDPAPIGVGTMDAFVYRCILDGEIYARPTYEFTEDRFAKAAA